MSMGIKFESIDHQDVRWGTTEKSWTSLFYAYLVKKILQRRFKLRRAISKYFSGYPRVSTTQNFVLRVKADCNSFQYSKAKDIKYCLEFWTDIIGCVVVTCGKNYLLMTSEKYEGILNLNLYLEEKRKKKKRHFVKVKYRLDNQHGEDKKAAKSKIYTI